MIDFTATPQIEIEDERRDAQMVGAGLNVENERRLAILETDLKHFQQQLVNLRGEVHSMNTAINSGFERVNSNIQALLIGQASTKGEKEGAGFVVHAAYIAVSIATGVAGFVVALRSFAS